MSVSVLLSHISTRHIDITQHNRDHLITFTLFLFLSAQLWRCKYFRFIISSHLTYHVLQILRWLPFHLDTAFKIKCPKEMHSSIATLINSSLMCIVFCTEHTACIASYDWFVSFCAESYVGLFGLHHNFSQQDNGSLDWPFWNSWRNPGWRIGGCSIKWPHRS